MLTTSPSLLQRLREPDAGRAWERFVDFYTPLLFAWTGRLGMNEQDAADLLQDVFAVLVEQLPKFEYDAGRSFRAWLKTLLLNRWRDRRRRKAAQRFGEGEMEALPAPESPPEFEEEEYRSHLASRVVQLMRDQFPDTTWKAFWGLVVEDRPAAAVAAELNISVNSAYLAKSRVLRRLREELSGLFD